MCSFERTVTADRLAGIPVSQSIDGSRGQSMSVGVETATWNVVDHVTVGHTATPNGVTNKSEWLALIRSWCVIVNTVVSIVMCYDSFVNSATDEWDSSSTVTVMMMSKCFEGVCYCSHRIVGCPVQLYPSQAFVECFLRGGADQDWQFIMYGTIFGFQVIDVNCAAAYQCVTKEICDLAWVQFISNKMRLNLRSGWLSRVDHSPVCSHNIFSVNKSTRDGYWLVVS